MNKENIWKTNDLLACLNTQISSWGISKKKVKEWKTIKPKKKKACSYPPLSSSTFMPRNILNIQPELYCPSWISYFFKFQTSIWCPKWAFPEKKTVPPCWGYRFFLKLTHLDFQSNLLWPPGIFHFFALTPLEIYVFSSIFSLLTPFNDFYSTLLELSIHILNRGVTISFLEKPNKLGPSKNLFWIPLIPSITY